MASAAIRTMTLGQNIHMMQNNCVLVSANMLAGKSQQMFSHGKRPIAPAPTVLTSNGANQVINIPKKKYNYGNMQYPSNQTVSVARRNARERNRVKQVNNGFSNLRQHIPQTVVSALTKGGRGSAKKLSKVDTLKMAVEYIRSLKDMLDENENSGSSSTSSYYSESNSLLQSIPRSESSLSPTPSYASDSSSHMSYTPNLIQSHQTHFKQEPFDTFIDPSTSPAPSYHSDIPIHHHQQIYQPTSTPYKPVHQFDNYSPVSAEDEDLLDAITWWQQQ
jgi:achaete-scute complex protein